MEQTPRTFDKIIGGTEEQRQNLAEKIDQQFEDWDVETLKTKEKLMSNEETQAIYLALERIYYLSEEMGFQFRHVPLHNIHIIKKSCWNRQNSNGFYSSDKQAIYICECDSTVVFQQMIFHELIHAASFQSWQLSGEGIPANRRLGWGALANDQDQVVYFRPINEAVTESLVKELMTEEFSHGAYKEDYENTKKLAAKNENTKNKSGENLFNDDVYYAYEVNGSVYTREYAYPLERESLDLLQEKLYQANKSKYPEKRAIKQLFARGLFMGEMLEMGRLVDKTFGRGVFRKIAEIKEGKALLEFVRQLQPLPSGRQPEIEIPLAA